MRSLLGVLACAVFAVVGATFAVRAGDAPAPPKGPIHVATFFEVTPTATNQAIAMLRQYRDAAKAEAGAMTVTVYQEVGTPFRFLSMEVWRDMAAYQTHSKAGSTTALAQRIKAIEFGPPDARPHAVHFAAEGKASAGAGAITVVSHLDVPPSEIPALLDLLKPLTEGAAKQPGMVTYQVLRQTAGAGNHFRNFEIWASEKAWEAHNLTKYAQDFRKGVGPLLGTPYDQRKYTVVN